MQGLQKLPHESVEKPKPALPQIEEERKTGKASYDMTEVRFIIKPDFTECYVYCEAHGDCPIGVQGWHYKVFPKKVPIIDIVKIYVIECILWPQKSPD